MVNIFNIFRKKTKDPSELWQETEMLLKPYEKPMWAPKVGNSEVSYLFSKFSGKAALVAKETWPACKRCKSPMQLLVQLNAKQFPAEMKSPFGEGILQLFCCDQCSKSLEDIKELPEISLVRVLDPKTQDLTGVESLPKTFSTPEKPIEGWEESVDYPNTAKLKSLGCDLKVDQAALLTEKGFPKVQDKLMGWPNWVQGIKYPKCSQCGSAMKLVIQIAPQDNLNIELPGGQCMHVIQCDKHKSEIVVV